MCPRTDSGDTNTLSEEAIDPPNVAIVTLSLLGKKVNGRSIDFLLKLHIKIKLDQAIT